jgi:hypothetical protein
MPRFTIADCLILLRGPTAALIVLGASWGDAVNAADHCLTEPKPDAAQDGHWYYLTNRVTQRKCWHLAPAGTDRERTDPAESQPAPTSAPASASPPAVVNVLPGTSAKENRKQPEPNATAAKPSRLRAYRPTGPEATLATDRPLHANRRPLASRGAEHPATLGQAQRDALFREFLHWQEQALFQDFLRWQTQHKDRTIQ